MIICQNGSAETFQLDFCAYSDIKNSKSRISVDDENAWMQKVKLILGEIKCKCKCEYECMPSKIQANWKMKKKMKMKI